MNHQRELDDLIYSIMPSPALENSLPWLTGHMSRIEQRINRLRLIRDNLESIKHKTHKQDKALNRYSGRIRRLVAVAQHREHLIMVANLRLKRLTVAGQTPSVNASREP